MRNDHSGGPDAGSRIDGGPGTLARRWADLGARSRDQARELDPPPLSPWTLDRQRSWTFVCAAPDGGFRRLKKLFRVSSADGSSNKRARGRLAKHGSPILDPQNGAKLLAHNRRRRRSSASSTTSCWWRRSASWSTRRRQQRWSRSHSRPRHLQRCPALGTERWAACARRLPGSGWSSTR